MRTYSSQQMQNQKTGSPIRSKFQKKEENHRQINQKIKSVEIDLKRIYDRLFIEYEDVTPLIIKRVYQRKRAIELPKQEKEKFTLIQTF